MPKIQEQLARIEALNKAIKWLKNEDDRKKLELHFPKGLVLGLHRALQDTFDQYWFEIRDEIVEIIINHLLQEHSKLAMELKEEGIDTNE